MLWGHSAACNRRPSEAAPDLIPSRTHESRLQTEESTDKERAVELCRIERRLSPGSNDFDNQHKRREEIYAKPNATSKLDSRTTQANGMRSVCAGNSPWIGNFTGASPNLHDLRCSRCRHRRAAGNRWRQYQHRGDDCGSLHRDRKCGSRVRARCRRHDHHLRCSGRRHWQQAGNFPPKH